MAKTLYEVKTALLAKAKSKPCGKYVVIDPSTGKVAANSASPFRHSFDQGKSWVEAQASTTTRYRSADGDYYEEASLPEQTDQYCTEKYAAEMRSERNHRINDTDAYVQLADMTVKKNAGGQRSALTAEEKDAVIEYRAALRNLPETSGWPFVDFPTVPDCIAVEVQEKINQREALRAAYSY